MRHVARLARAYFFSGKNQSMGKFGLGTLKAAADQEEPSSVCGPAAVNCCVATSRVIANVSRRDGNDAIVVTGWRREMFIVR